MDKSTWQQLSNLENVLHVHVCSLEEDMQWIFCY